MSPSRAPIGRVEWTRWVAAMACRCGRSTHGDNDAPRSDVQGSTPPPRRRRGACESSRVFQLAACARPAAAASRARPDPDIRLGSGMVIRRESVPPSGQARRGLRPRVRLTCLGLPDPPYWGGSQPTAEPGPLRRLLRGVRQPRAHGTDRARHRATTCHGARHRATTTPVARPQRPSPDEA